MLTSASWLITQFETSLHITIHDHINPLCDEHKDSIEEVWQQKTVQHPTLYNGRVFCVDDLTPDHISGHWNCFKNVLGQMTRPDLFIAKPLKPLAVVGLFHAADGIIIGQRSPKSIYLPGYWQGAPAGNVEARENNTTIDLAEQLEAEALEELGLPPETMTIGRPILACEHPDTHIIDIGMPIHSKLSFQTIQEHCQMHGNAEYGQLKCLPRDALHAFDGLMVPTLRALLEQA